MNQGAVGNDLDDFQDMYGLGDAQVARAIVNRAIVDWNAVITDQNFDNDNDPDTNDFQLTILAGDLGGGSRGQAQITERTTGGAGQGGWDIGTPMEATITMDDSGGDVGWFFDTTPLDDIEFTGIADDFQASFVDATAVGQARQNDFYRTITHEIGHALGISLTDTILGLNSGQAVPPTITVGNTVVGPNPRYDILGLTSLTRYTTTPNTTDDWLGQLVFVGTDQVGQLGFLGDVSLNGNPAEDIVYNHELWRYDFQNTPGMSVTFTESGGGHFYEGTIANPVHPNELMNPGRVVPAGNDPAETTRQFISDLTVEFLADAYGYEVTLPSTLDSAHTMLDQYTGTLLVQGLPGAVIDTIDITVVGANSDRVRVVVNNHAEEVPLAEVTQILIARNGGNDNVTVAPELAHLQQDIDYVVSSNEDALEAVGQSTTDGIVDLSNIVPGNQTTLRAAIVEANARTGAQSIYVGRGIYNLTLTGTGGDTQGDLDITGNVSIVGAGAGLTVIDATAVVDRVFQVTGSLDLSRVTVTGGNAVGSVGGGIWVLGTLNLSQSAIVDNTANFLAGGIRNQGTTVITRSVITDNQLLNTMQSSNGGGGLYSDVVDLTIGSTIVARNSANFGEQDINNGPAAAYVSVGSNLLTSAPANLAGVFDETGDRVAAIDHVVTSLGDISDANDDGFALTLREALAAVSLVNSDPMEVVAVPGWSFVVDEFLAVSENTSLQGVGAAFTSVATTHPNGVVFAVLGDIDQDGTIGQEDFDFVLLNWSKSLGDLNVAAHEAVWELYFSTDDEGNDITVNMNEQDDMLLGWGFGLVHNVNNFLTGIIDISWS